METELFSLPGADAPRVYVRALTLCCFHSLIISTQTFRRGLATVTLRAKLQALVYGIRPSTTAVFSYAVGSRKLSANEQFFVGA